MTEFSENNAWYLAQIKPNCQSIAERNLHQQGYQVFLPLIRETIRRRGKFSSALKPLFPGYVFVGLGAEAINARAIGSTYGISSLVRFGTSAAQVPSGLICQLRQRCDSENALIPDHAFQSGDTVKIQSGPFADFLATVASLPSEQRAWVLIDLMGRETRVAVEVNALHKVP